MPPRIEKVIEAAKAGGEVLKKYFGQSLETIRKTTAADFVTKADVESERNPRSCLPLIPRVMTNWSPAFDLCLLASGRIEAMVSMGNDLYDFAAGKIIAREAGATITDLGGNEERDDNQLFIASNGTEIHARLVGIINV